MSSKLLTALKAASMALVVAASLGFAAPGVDAAGVKRVALHVDENDKARMNLVLNNAQNVIQYYESKGQKVEVRIVAYGPGLNMLVKGKSPVADRVASLGMLDNLSFAACGNTHKAMSKKAGKEVALLPEAKMVPSGVVELIELQEKGWAYIRP